MNGTARPFAALCATRCFLYRSLYETVCRFLAPSLLALRPLVITFKIAHREPHERRGEAVRCATAFYIARLLARSLHSGLSLLRSDYFFA